MKKIRIPRGRSFKKIAILFILLSACASFGAQGFTYFWTPKSKDTVTSVRLKANYDTTMLWAGRIADTITYGTVKWSGHMLHDSTFSWLNIDTIKGTPLYLKGRMIGDTIAGTFSSATNGNFTNLTYDSTGGRVIKASGPITADSIYTRELISDSLGSRWVSFPCSLSGFSSLIPMTGYYKYFGNIIFVSFFSNNGYGTSNSGFMAITSIPSGIRPPTNQMIPINGALDNGNQVSAVLIASNNSSWSIYNTANVSSGGWTGSGTKGFYNQSYYSGFYLKK